MVVIPFINWITFGLVHWICVHILIPLANLTTFHTLQPQLLNSNWVIGAAIVLVSISFRNAHAYQGIAGEINAWYIGMLLFWLVFNYGLFTAIVAHVVYDAIIFTMRALNPE